MLVLSRKTGERIVIDGNVTVVIKRIAGNRVTLGIEAPQTVHVVRGELKPFERPTHTPQAAVFEVNTEPGVPLVAKPR